MNTREYSLTKDVLYVSGGDHCTVSDCAGELIMPDYYPEIRRIVSVKAQALPDSKYLSEAGLELGGTLAFTVLYVGDDGALSCVPYVTEYSATLPVERDCPVGISDIFLESVAEGVTCRPLGPRTMSLKAKVKSRVVFNKAAGAFCDTVCKDESGDAPSNSRLRSVELLQAEVPSVRRSYHTVTGTASGEAHGSGMSPILCKGTLTVHEARAGRDSVTVTGNIEVSCLCQGADGVYKPFSMSIPFEESISAEGALSGDLACAAGRVASVNISASGDLLCAEAEYDLDVCVAHPVTVTVTKDAYSPIAEAELQKEDMAVQCLVCMGNLSHSVSGEGRRRTGPREGERIIFSGAEAGIDRMESSEGRALLTGSCTFSAVVAQGGDCSIEEFTVPIKLEAPALADALSGECTKTVSISTSECVMRLEGERITGKCRLGISVNATREKKISAITKIAVGERTSKDQDGIIRICYPEKGKRIWDIAKERGFGVSSCERSCGVSRNDISDGSPLIIR